jgi:predicted nucleotidyltransferase
MMLCEVAMCQPDDVSRHRRSAPAAPITPTGFPNPVAEALPRAVQRIVEALQPEKVVLFGSYAYGRPTPDSDVDLLIIMETSAPDKERYLSVCRLLRPRPFPVDILVRTPREVARALEKGDFFIREIMSQGKVLYERRY